jgi:putative peptide maturation dehydrogenase
VPEVRRTRYAFLYCADRPFLEVGALLRGEIAPTSIRELRAVSILAGREYELPRAEFEALLALPADRWVDVEGSESVDRLADKGIVLMRAGGGRLAELRHRDALLQTTHWNVYGALYHSLTRWRDADVGIEGVEEEAGRGEASVDLERAVIERFGRPPPHFYSAAGQRESRDLPLVRHEGGLYEALASRRTSRAFDEDATLSESELATILYEVYGCHGYAPFGEGMAMLHKTSPSGGALHPIEVYPLLIRVEGMEPGLYHYSVERHALELLEPMASHDAVATARQFTSGQGYFARAAALFVLVARFGRRFWRYRNQERAYGVLLMEIGHLSQTFYLVCADQGLGAFFTAAINAENIDDRLGLDGFAEGALAISGCGRRVDGPSVFEPEFRPYVPRKTRI